MFKKIGLFLLCLLLALSFASCGKPVIKPDSDGIAHAQLGDILRSAQRDIQVVSAQIVEQFGFYTPLKGEMLIDVVIKTTNRADQPLILSETDYQLQWGTVGFADPLLAALDQEEMAPPSAPLKKGASAEYHYLYSVPEYTAIFQVCYLEAASRDQPRSLFYVDFSV